MQYAHHKPWRSEDFERDWTLLLVSITYTHSVGYSRNAYHMNVVSGSDAVTTTLRDGRPDDGVTIFSKRTYITSEVIRRRGDHRVRSPSLQSWIFMSNYCGGAHQRTHKIMARSARTCGARTRPKRAFSVQDEQFEQRSHAFFSHLHGFSSSCGR
jgi:hypothetical protein